MKYSEFNHDWSDMELQHLEGEIFVYRDGVMIGKVSKEYRYMMSTHYAGFEELPLPVAVKLFADMAMLAQTPLAEREEEKRYRLWLSAYGASDFDLYRTKGHGLGGTNLNVLKSVTDPLLIFTESEIAELDIDGFEKVEVLDGE